MASIDRTIYRYVKRSYATKELIGLSLPCGESGQSMENL